MEISNATLVERLQKLSSSVVSDVLDVCGYKKIVAGLNAGAPREQVFAANPRFDHIRRLQ